MVIAAVIASYVYDTNRRGAVTLSNDLLDAIDQRIAIQMGAYLAPAEQFLELARAIGGERGVFDGALAAEPFVLATLGKHRADRGLQLRRSRRQLPLHLAQRSRAASTPSWSTAATAAVASPGPGETRTARSSAATRIPTTPSIRARAAGTRAR